MKVCPICWEKEEEEKECRHDKDNFVEIDDNIFDIIVMLNKKGYHTRYCCGGHDRLLDEVYIMFSKWDSHDIINRLDVKKDIGLYWKLTNSNCIILPSILKEIKTKLEAKYFLSDRRDELREWAEKL